VVALLRTDERLLWELDAESTRSGAAGVRCWIGRSCRDCIENECVDAGVDPYGWALVKSYAGER